MIGDARAEEGPTCEWEGCARPAVINVLVGDLLGRTRARYGSYCVPHSVIRSRDLREKTGKDVWFSIIRSKGGGAP